MILVTGASGLLGSHICTQLVENGHRVSALIREKSDLALLIHIKDKIDIVYGDILNPDELNENLQGVEMIIHCAAVVSFQSSDKKSMLDVNVTGTSNMINLAIDNNVNYFIHISSVAALGRLKGKNTVDENSKWEKSNLNTNYAYSKHLAEIEVWRGIEEGLNAVIINPSVILSTDDLTRSSGQLFKYVLDENRFYPTGQVNYVDIRDVCSLIVKCIDKRITKERFVVNGGATTFQNLFENIAIRVDKKAPNIKTTGLMNWAGLVIDYIKCLMTKSKRSITKETIRLSNTEIFFDNAKVKEHFNFKFRTLEETLDWCCSKISKSQ